MLTRASFDNFKNLRRVDVDLSPLTVLVGPNGGGKTSVLQGLYVITEAVQHLARSRTHASKSVMRGFLKDFSPSRFATHGQASFQIKVYVGPESITLLLTHGSDGAPFTITVGTGHSNLVNVDNLGTTPRSPWPRLPRAPASVLLQLDPAKMVQTSVVDRAEPTLAANGQGLASVLSYLAGAYPDRKEAIEADVAAIVPWFRRVRVTPAEVSRSTGRGKAPPERLWGHQFTVEATDGAQIPADLVSEGTVLTLGLLTLLHAPNPPELLLLDDIDRALHLGAQVRLVRTLRKLQETRPELQIVASTHSPFLLQEFAAQDVRVLGLKEDGVHCRALSEHPEYARWKGVLGTGEIWANLGEDWVGDGA